MSSKTEIEHLEILDQIIIGRVDPHIYAFTTNTVPNYLKVGDTYRPVAKRLAEWRKHYPELKKQYEEKAIIDDETYFRDYSIHQYLENDLNKERLLLENINSEIYYSKEFFKETEVRDVVSAISDIKENYKDNTGKYDYYSSKNRLPETFKYQRGEVWKPRPNQQEVIDNFINAVNNGRRNLLMYAVMRFGKSFTSLCCALEMEAKLVLVLSAKADVKDEWKKTVESAGNFKDYVFLSSNDLLVSVNAIEEQFSVGKKVVLFLTLQDLQGKEIKDKHREVFDNRIDLLIVDETHFGARAASFGEILRNAGYEKTEKRNISKLEDESIDTKKASEEIKKINARIRLHLSGTPYRILMGSEFEKEDIISFVQFSDIVEEKEKWDEAYLDEDDVNEWDNPYYGFPQMVRFAFNPNKSSREKMNRLKENGISFEFSKLLEPRSIKKDKKKKLHKKFKNEKEILDLLKVIDGTKEDEELFGFLNYDKIKEGKMCRHMVMVLPYCASCDAMEELIRKNKDVFKNLNSYKIINISGVDSPHAYRKPIDVKNKIRNCESENSKTLTLTVNRMLTGSTVEQWDTMIYLKDTASPQEYDQSIFRLQNQYTRTLVGEKGIIKQNLKPQTLLVDFDPNRLFRMQEQKALIYNVNTEENGNKKLKERISRELEISPVIVMNKNKIKQVEATNILEAVSEYNNQRSISDEVHDIPIDMSILNDDEIRFVIESQGEFGSKQGMTINPVEGEEEEFDMPKGSDDKDKKKNDKKSIEEYVETKKDDERKKFKNQIKTYYQRLLFFSFLTKDRVSSMDDILAVIDKDENVRLAINLNIEKEIVKKISEQMDPFIRSSLDYKIQNVSNLATDETVEPLERAKTSLKKFNRMSESEVITPANVCEDIVALIPKSGLENIIHNDYKILDIASKSGEFAVSLYKKLTEDLGFSHEKVKDSIYSIPTSSIAYEFTRRFYEILDLNISNIAYQFNSYNLLDLETNIGENNYEEITELLTQNIKFSEINFEEKLKKGGKKVKFGAVVGNPPYQVSDNDSGKGSAMPLYHRFVLMGHSICSNYTSMIIPSVWFVGGKGLDKFREFMINSQHLEYIKHFSTSQDIFSHVNLRGGVNYFLLNKNYNNHLHGLNVTNVQNGEIITSGKQKAKIENLDFFIPDNIAVNLLNKLIDKQIINLNDSTLMFEDYVSVRNPYGFSTTFVKSDEFLDSEDLASNPIKIYASRGRIGYVEKSKIIKNSNWIKEWKVLTPFANNIGTNLSDDNLNTLIGEPDSISTETYLVIGAEKNLTKNMCSNIQKYLMTKFVRFLISLAKANQNGTRKTYRFVPIQNFSNNSDINWNKTIDEIDVQLFDKYNLSNEERIHIKNIIKDM